MTGCHSFIVYQRPDMTVWQRAWWNVYQVLAGSRQIGMAAGPIPLSEILAYCQLYNIHDPDDIDDLVYMVGELDTEMLKEMGVTHGNK